LNRADIIKRVQVHVPFHRLRNDYLPLVIREKLNPEISFNHESLDKFNRDDYLETAKKITDAGLSVTFHAPFLDLRPGAIDPRILQVSRDRLNQVFDLVPCFHPRSVVCHSAFDERYYISAEQKWLENSIETWSHFTRIAEQTDTVIVLENVYETNPCQLVNILSAISSGHLRFCFDAGHHNVFAKSPLDDWAGKLFSYLHQVHVHDNRGATDEHLAIGNGTFPFARLFDMIRERKINPIITIEAHSEKTLWQSLSNMESMKYLEPFFN
jgi:sugar phosphate isomerase/epimerase